MKPPTPDRPLPPAAMGFRVKTGWAASVLLSGPLSRLRVVESRQVQLSDPSVPDSRQPYHAGFGTARADQEAVRRLIRIVQRHARASLSELMRDYRATGHPIEGIGIVAGSDVAPETIANPHIRAHAFEGQLYRDIIEAAARRWRVPVEVYVEKELLTTGADRLKRSASQLKRAVVELSPDFPGPWRADEKAATLAAWLLLESRSHFRKRSTKRAAGKRGS